MRKWIITIICAVLFGILIDRKLFPKRKIITQTQVIEHEVVKLDTVRVKKTIFIEKVRPEKVVLSPTLQPPDVIFPQYNFKGLWRVKGSPKKLQAWGFFVENDSIRTFYQEWKCDLRRKWVLEPCFRGEDTYYTLLQKRLNLRPFWGLGVEYSRQFNLYLWGGIEFNHFRFYGKADFHGLSVGVNYTF